MWASTSMSWRAIVSPHTTHPLPSLGAHTVFRTFVGASKPFDSFRLAICFHDSWVGPSLIIGRTSAVISPIQRESIARLGDLSGFLPSPEALDVESENDGAFEVRFHLNLVPANDQVAGAAKLPFAVAVERLGSGNPR